MCDQCWSSRGEPAIWNDRVATAVALTRDLYELGNAGPWHSVLGNWNVTDATVAYCGSVVAGWGWDDDYADCVNDPLPAAQAAAAALWPLLAAMTEDERTSVIAFTHGYAERPA